jgi:hypothetical protein
MDLFELLNPQELALVDQLKSEVQHIVQVGLGCGEGFGWFPVAPGPSAQWAQAFGAILQWSIAWSQPAQLQPVVRPWGP